MLQKNWKKKWIMFMIMNTQKAKIYSIVISTPKNKQEQNIIRKQQWTDGKKHLQYVTPLLPKNKNC